MTPISIPSKSKSPSVPLLQRGRQVMAAAVFTCFGQARIEQAPSAIVRVISPFAKGGQGGFALSAKGETP